jgi:hypothetical protein
MCHVIRRSHVAVGDRILSRDGLWVGQNVTGTMIISLIYQQNAHTQWSTHRLLLSALSYMFRHLMRHLQGEYRLLKTVVTWFNDRS